MQIGENVTIESGSEVGDGTFIGDNVHILSGVRVLEGRVIPKYTIMIPHFTTSFLLQLFRDYIPPLK